jgi:hypothetical protein
MQDKKEESFVFAASLGTMLLDIMTILDQCDTCLILSVFTILEFLTCRDGFIEGDGS